MSPEARLTELDTFIAADAIEYGYYPEASKWWNERNLYEQLAQHPELASGNAVMQGFLASVSGSPMAQLAQIAVEVQELFSLSAAQQNTLSTNAAAIDALLAQLESVDSLLAVTTDPLQLSGLKNQRDSLLTELDARQAENEAVAQQLMAQKQSGLPGISSTLAAISPSNVYESNEKYVLQVFVEKVLSNAVPDSISNANLRNIGLQCPYEAGPVVYFARSLLAGFTAEILPEVDCPEVGNRSDEQNKPLAANMADIMLYPNPAGDVLNVHLPDNYGEGNYRLTVSNILGETASDIHIYAGGNQVPVNALPSGAYFVRITLNGLNVFSSPLLIQH